MRTKGSVQAWIRDAVAIPQDECVVWPFGCNEWGYGTMHWAGRKRLAHHVALILVGRELPATPLECAHSCGVARCVNPRHIRATDHASNMKDAVAHGTQARGERMGNAKLTEQQVVEIRSASGTLAQIGVRYGVSLTTIWSVRTRRTWNHIPQQHPD